MTNEELIQEPEGKQRSATDLLLSVEDKINAILAYIKNIDHTNKLILSKYNQTITKNPTSGNKDLPLKKEELEQSSEISSEEVSVEKNISIKKKIPVSQKITYKNNNANVFMADVSILNSNNELIKKTRTNNAGKWVAALQPGLYSIKIERTPTNDNPKLDIQYKVQVRNIEGPIELQPVQV